MLNQGILDGLILKATNTDEIDAESLGKALGMISNKIFGVGEAPSDSNSAILDKINTFSNQNIFPSLSIGAPPYRALTPGDIQLNRGGAFANQGAIFFGNTNNNYIYFDGTNFNITSPVALAAGQIAFPTTQNPSGGPNVLDDYEEGSWTPTFVASTPGAPTYSSQGAIYVKIGRNVFCKGRLILTGLGGSVGTVQIGGLPFTVGAAHSTIQVGYGTTANPGVWLGGYVVAGSTVIQLNFKAAASVTWATPLTTADAGGAFDILFSFSYMASA